MTLHRRANKRVTFDPETVVRELQQQSALPITPTDVGMGTSLRVRPSSLFAPNVPSAVQPPSDIGIGPATGAMLGKRDDADEGSLKKLDTKQRLREDTQRVCAST
jgi:hypothetical protein